MDIWLLRETRSLFSSLHLGERICPLSPTIAAERTWGQLDLQARAHQSTQIAPHHRTVQKRFDDDEAVIACPAFNPILKQDPESGASPH